MRLRRPAVAATSLGLAGALLPATGAAAAEPNRHVVVTEDVTYEDIFGGTSTCTVTGRLDWILGEDGSQDNTLFATTSIGGGSDCGSGDPSFLNAGVTLRWTNHGFRRSQTYTYTGEGDVEITVSGQATPYNFYNDRFGADQVSSTHTASFADCVSNCEWSRTLTFPK
jgi:hypothetical protein